MTKATDAAREYFKRKGMEYTSDPQKLICYPIHEDDIFVLYKLCIKHIKAMPDNYCNMRMSARIKYKNNPYRQDMREAYLFVNGGYFTQREAISFNADGFIGFAGWAADENLKPFLDAFYEWVDWFVKSYGEKVSVNKAGRQDMQR